MGARKCHCWDCVSIREDLRDSKGYHVEDEFETPYRKKGKGKKKCKRSKDGKHDFSLKKEGIAWQHYYEYPSEERDGVMVMLPAVRKYGPRPKTYIVCAKCNKPERWGWQYGL